MACLELALKSGQSSFWISLTQLLNGSAEINGIDLSISTCHGLQNGIVDEDVLLLLNHTEGIGKLYTTVYLQNSQKPTSVHKELFVKCILK